MLSGMGINFPPSGGIALLGRRCHASGVPAAIGGDKSFSEDLRSYSKLAHNKHNYNSFYYLYVFIIGHVYSGHPRKVSKLLLRNRCLTHHIVIHHKIIRDRRISLIDPKDASSKDGGIECRNAREPPISPLFYQLVNINGSLVQLMNLPAV